MWFKLQTYFLIAILGAYWLEPIVPFVGYLVMKEYIVENICEERYNPDNCCQGMCHIEKEINKNSENTNSASTKENSQKRNIENDSFSFDCLKKAEIKQIQTRTTTSFFYKFDICPNFHSGIFVPPEYFI